MVIWHPAKVYLRTASFRVKRLTSCIAWKFFLLATYTVILQVLLTHTSPLSRLILYRFNRIHNTKTLKNSSNHGKDAWCELTNRSLLTSPCISRYLSQVMSVLFSILDEQQLWTNALSRIQNKIFYFFFTFFTEPGKHELFKEQY